MEIADDSVFNLITALCESFSIGPAKVKKLRSNCYENLLKKKNCQDPRMFPDLEGTNEPTLNLLAWCYRLTQEYDFVEAARELQLLTDTLKGAYESDAQSFNGILTFLLCLKNLPKKTNNILDLSSLPEIDYEIINFDNVFKLPSEITEEFERAKSNDIFNIFYEPPIQSVPELKAVRSTCDLMKDEGYSSPNNKESIWDLASQMKLSLRRNWESYGCGPPDKEKPFLSELGDLSQLWVENLHSLYPDNLFPSFTLLNNKMKPRKVFIKDLKYLLVGMPSETFNLSCREDFFISPGIMVEGITPDTIQRFCAGFLFAGTCYRALNRMATPNLNTRKYKHPGYVFTEFCESLARYLQFYRTAVFSLSDETNFLTFHKRTYKIQAQISILASICKLGPYESDSEQIPHGVALLNYLYLKILSLSDRDLCMVLYSIFYPCCQIYFSRFLHRWLIKGLLNDPYGEFFITPNLKYLATRGRTYWTRSYVIKEDLIPDFLIELAQDILYCGRIMNLLQLCNPMNKLCLYLMGKNPVVFTCCLTSDKLTQLEQNSSKYYLEASAECGTKFDIVQHLEYSREADVGYLELIAKKRASTLQRIELERQKIAQEQHEKRLEELLMLREQYETALELKQLNIYKDIEREIRTIEDNVRIEQIRERLIEDEAAKIINHYTELCRLVDVRKEKIENHIKCASSIQIDIHAIHEKRKESSVQDKGNNTSSESFYSAADDEPLKFDILKEEDIVRPLHSSESMDLLNANFEKDLTEENGQKAATIITTSAATRPLTNPNIQQAIDNFEFARKIKQKVLNQELDVLTECYFRKPNIVKEKSVTSHLTPAQRNKLKVLSSEFGINIIRDNVKTEGVLTVAQVNRNKVLGHNECFVPNYGSKPLDNESFVNKNVKDADTELKQIKKSRSLQLDISVKSDSEKFVPMSVDSTPMSDLPLTVTPLSEFPRSVTPSSMALSTDMKLESYPTKCESLDDVFSLTATSVSNTSPCVLQSSPELRNIPIFSKRATVEDATGISRNSINLFLKEGISISLITQLKLANNEILKYFIWELKYLEHLRSLRDYFFLQDGEFGRNITENLFEKLYSSSFPLDLINCRTLQHLVFSALDNSSKFQENSKHLSFKINSLPKCFDLNDPDVLGCLSLTYKVNWPLNILLPSDAVAKYDQVFKFLLKLNRVSWILKKIFLELKLLAKKTGKKEIYLMTSPQYRRMHQCRHVMSHFMQTLQNYIVGEILQPSWCIFEKSLLNVTNIDELYTAHTTYIKDIMFRCMLNQKSGPLRNIIQNIFVVILKFHDYLKAADWRCEEGIFIHPNFNKLDRIFKNFEEFVVYFFRVVRKVSKSGYQPCLIQFLDVLNVNDYYSKKLIKNV